jgi:hypothetical protein
LVTFCFKTKSDRKQQRGNEIEVLFEVIKVEKKGLEAGSGEEVGSWKREDRSFCTLAFCLVILEDELLVSTSIKLKTKKLKLKS